MFVLDSVSCADTFPQDGASGSNVAQLIAQNGSSGGYAQVSSNDVMLQLAYDPDGSGSLQWTQPVHVGVGNVTLAPGTRGIRFRNYVAGAVAVISAGLSEPSEPPLNLTAAGIATPSTPLTSPQILYAKAPLVNVGGTATEFSIVTGSAIATSAGMKVPANTLSPGDLMRLKMAGGVLNNSGLARTYRLRVLIGNSVAGAGALFDETFAPNWISATEHPWDLDLLIGMPAVDLFDAYGDFSFAGNASPSAATVGTVGVSSTAGSQDYAIGSNGQPAAAFHTSDIFVDVSMTFSAANGALAWRTFGVELEYLKGT